MPAEIPALSDQNGDTLLATYYYDGPRASGGDRLVTARGARRSSQVQVNPDETLTYPPMRG